MIINKSFYVDTTPAIDLLTITHEVRRVVLEGKSDTGWVTIIITNPGAGVVMMEKEGTFGTDLQKSLAPFLKDQVIRCLIPRSVVIPIEKGRMMMEPWQEVILIDFETTGRRREFRVQLFGETKEAPKAAPPPAGGGRK